jgi:hypothetical protein
MTVSHDSAWPLALLTAATFLVQPDTLIHETGHLTACYLQGNKVTVWNPITPWWHAETACTNQNTALFTAGGTFTSVLVWTICTVIFAIWLSRRRGTTRPWITSALCLEWSFFCLGELALWAWQAREHPAVNDSARFVAATGISPAVVIPASLTLLTLLFVGVLLPTLWKLYRAFTLHRLESERAYADV